MNNLEYQRRDYYDNLREERDAAMAALTCPECGRPDGMVAVDRAGVRQCPTLAYYWLHAMMHEVYTPCPECNPRRQIPIFYSPADAAWLLAWLDSDCLCADCWRERKAEA